MNVAVIGTGTIAETQHIPILKSLPDVNIVAVCDTAPKRLSRVADAFNIDKKYSEVDSMLNDIGIDFVDIATPGFTHYEIAKKVLSHDINLLIEKPATLKSDESKFLEAESTKRNLRIGVCQTYRYRTPIIELQKLRKSGRIGTINRMVTMQQGSTLFAMPPWFLDEKLSGGILFELGTHAIDLQCYLMGKPKNVLHVNSYFDKKLIARACREKLRADSGQK